MDHLTKIKENKLFGLINELKEKHKADDEIQFVLREMEKELRAKKYGLVWEEYEEPFDIMRRDHIPVFTEEVSEGINAGENAPYHFILKGDNLHSLYLLEKTHKGKIDVIYIDPPYNTGHEDFVYNDNYISEEDAYRHSKWLSFMEKRLVIAQRLLTDDGVIFISIDDNEQANLKLLCDSIFGEENFITQFCWEKTQHFGRQKINFYSNCEYVLCYAKNLCNTKNNKLKELLVEKIKTKLDDAPLYNAINKENIFRFRKGIVRFHIKDGTYVQTTNPSYELIKPVIVRKGRNASDLVLKFRSRWSQQTIDEEAGKGTYFMVKSEGFAVRAVYHKGKAAKESPKQLIFTNAKNPLCAYSRFGTKVGVNEEGRRELEKIVGKSKFSYPKPVSLVKYLISLYYDYNNRIHKNDITVLDFFAGSGTAGQAVLELNREDGGKRRFILCTNNEGNICDDVTCPRIRTVITGIRADGSRYSDGIRSNLKVYHTDFVSADSHSLHDELHRHIREMMQLEHSISSGGSKCMDEQDWLQRLNGYYK